MKTSSVIALIIFFAMIARSQQSGWVKQDASSLSIYIKAGHSIDANTLVVVGEKSRILRSSDGGISWSIQASQVTEELYDIHFINSTTGWAAGSGGAIIKTTDGGNSWKYLNSGTKQDLNSVRFLDPQIGWATGDSLKILKTSDGGETWTVQYGGSSIYEMNDIYPLSATSAVAVGYQSGNGVFRTSDGGGTWTTPVANGWMKDVSFLDNSRAWAVGITASIMSYTSDPFGGGGWTFNTLRGTIWKTTDGGVTWASGVTTLSKWLYGVHFIDSNTGWTVGAAGLIMKTSDGGTQWTLPSSGTTKDLYSVYFLNAQTGWALGASGVFLKSTDGGNTWQSVNLGTTANLRNIRFIDSQTGWICGGSGLILKTTDGGTTWQQLSGGASKYLNAVHFPDQQNGWAVGQGGVVQKTTDGGLTWASQISAVPVQFSQYSGFYCVYFCNSSTGWAAGSDGTIMKTTDGGNQWVQQNSTTTKQLNSLYFINLTTGWIAGLNGTLLSTTDGGTTWTSRTSATTQDLTTVFFSDEQYGWSAGGSYSYPNYRNVFQRTTDGGLTWHSDSTEVLAQNTALYFRDRTTGWMGNGNGHIFKTTDGGAHWKAQLTNSYYSIVSICFADASRGYAFYSYGMLKTTDGGGPLMITPNPIAPLNQARGMNQNTTLVWSSSAGAQSYKVQVALKVDFRYGSIVSEKSGTLDTTHSVTGLVAGSTYYWRVCAEYSNGTSFWSTPQSFEVLGMTWRTQVSGTSSGINSVYFIDSQQGWVVGYYGTALSSSNGGRTWIKKTISTSSSDLNSVFFTNSLSGWIVGDGGKIFRTTNGGLQWVEQQSGVTRNLYSVRFANAAVGWIVGDYGTILKTTDGGNSWNAQSVGSTSSMTSVAVIDENTALVACWGILKTTNGGTTWSSVSTESARAIDFITPSRGCAVGYNGTALYSTNGGNTWSRGDQLSFETLCCIQMADTLHGWAAGGKGMFQYTADGGKTWQNKSMGATTTYYGMHALNDSTIWLVGSSGTILKSSRSPGVVNTQPSLVYPADLATGIPVQPTLQWSPVYAAASYSLQVSRFSSFSMMTIDSSGIQGTSLTIGGLWNNYRYYWRVAAFDADGAGPWSSNRSFTTTQTTAVEQLSNGIPTEFSLSQNYPNPFNPTTTIQFALPRVSQVSLKVFDLLGKEVATLASEELGPGYFSVRWQADFPSGTYIYRLQARPIDGGQAREFVDTKKMLLLH